MVTAFQVTFDCADPAAQARFWTAALGYIEEPPPAGYASWEAWAREHQMLHLLGAMSAAVDPEGLRPRLLFQRVPEPKVAKNRMHLDLHVSDARGADPEGGRSRVDAEAARLVSLGARHLRTFEKDGEYWAVLQDPEGNEFCVQ